MMNYVRISLFSVLILPILLHAGATTAPAQTRAASDSLFADYLHEAYTNSNRLLSAVAQWRAALQTSDQLGALPDPEVMLQYYVNPEQFDGPFAQATISVQQMFPWFGARAEARDYGNLVAQSRRDAVDAVRLEVFAEVREAWFALHTAARMQRYLQEHLDWVVRLERLTRSRLETGYASRTEMLRLEIERVEIASELHNADVMLRGQSARFNILLGRDAMAELRLVEGPTEVFLAVWSGETADFAGQHPRVREMETMRRAGEVMERRARLEGYPMVGFGAELMGSNYLTRMPDGRLPVVARVNVTLPVWRTKYRAAAEQARSETQMFARQRDAMHQELSAAVAMAQAEFEAAHEQVRRYRDHLIPRSKELTDLLLLDYSGGRAQLEAVIMARRESVNYAMELEQAVLAHNRAVARLESLTGQGFGDAAVSDPLAQ